MTAVTDLHAEPGFAGPPEETGALPDAPLAMPKQRLEPERPQAFGLLTGMLRPFFARAGRSRG
jgi:hypothetical protein